MKKLHLFTIMSTMLVAFACSKNQVRTNHLDGRWDVTRMEIFGSDGNSSLSTDPEGMFEFHRCNLRRNDYCPYTEQLSYTQNSVTYTVRESGEYRFDERGRMLILRERNDDGSFREVSYNVIDFSRKMLRLENMDASRTMYTLEKMD